MSLHFDHRVAIVTGAGQGLGRTYALELAARGAAVVVNDLGGATDGTGGSHSAADTVVAEIEAAGGRAAASYSSVATPEGGQSVVDTALEAFGRLDVVVNNAGILRDKSFLKLEWTDLDAVIDVHLKGAFYVSRPAFAVMKEQSYGRLVFTGSNVGMFGNFGQANYAAAKAGLFGLSNVLSIEGARFGINSNVVLPVAKTRLTEELMGEAGEILDPSLVTSLVVWLSSEACSTSHGVFSAVGGRYAEVFTGLTRGWFAGAGERPSAEDLAAHWEDVRGQDGYLVPASVNDELAAVTALLAPA